MQVSDDIPVGNPTAKDFAWVRSQASGGAYDRAKIVAQILTDNGHQVDSPDSGTLDDVEWERWNVCLQIVQALDDMDPKAAALGRLIQRAHAYWLSIGAPGAAEDAVNAEPN